MKEIFSVLSHEHAETLVLKHSVSKMVWMEFYTFATSRMWGSTLVPPTLCPVPLTGAISPVSKKPTPFHLKVNALGG